MLHNIALQNGDIVDPEVGENHERMEGGGGGLNQKLALPSNYVVY